MSQSEMSRQSKLIFSECKGATDQHHRMSERNLNSSLVKECAELFTYLPFAECESQEINDPKYFQNKQSWEGEVSVEKLVLENMVLHEQISSHVNGHELQRVWFERELNDEKMKRSKGRSFWESRGLRECEDELRKQKLIFASEKSRLLNQANEAHRLTELYYFRHRNTESQMRIFTQQYRDVVEKLKSKIDLLTKEKGDLQRQMAGKLSCICFKILKFSRAMRGWGNKNAPQKGTTTTPSKKSARVKYGQ